jgi:hypothetical protein
MSTRRRWLTRSSPRSTFANAAPKGAILTLARGHYCPREHQQHLQLAAFQAKVRIAYTQIVTITTDNQHTLQDAGDLVALPRLG